MGRRHEQSPQLSIPAACEKGNEYLYQPFPDDGKCYIRIATIQPGSFNEDIRISLRLEQLDSDHTPVYEAMSYAWGLPVDSPPRISVNHPQHHHYLRHFSPSNAGSLSVRPNLFLALRHVRLETKPRHLWIDAICIDQDNISDKAAQVAMMGEIYARAAKVLVWLGPEENDSTRAMGLMQHLGMQAEVDWYSHATVPSKDAEDTQIADTTALLECEEEEMLALHHLFQREWFDRLWIRQEIGLATQNSATVMCGSVSVPWKHFRIAWHLIKEKPRFYFDEANRFSARLDQLSSLLHQQSTIYLGSLRMWIEQGICSVPHDRIYAMRALLSPAIQQAIKPDYTLSKVDAFRDVAVAYLDTMGDLDILTQCQFSKSWNGPSWVPDWSSNKLASKSLLRQPVFGMIKTAFKINGPQTLQVMGVFVSDVTEVKPLYPFPTDDSRQQLGFEVMLHRIRLLMLDKTNPLENTYPAGNTYMDAFVRTLCLNYFRDNYELGTHDERPSYQGVKDFLWKHVNQRVRPGYLSDEDGIAHDYISTICIGKMFIRTANGLIGLAVQAVEPGDQIWTIFGCLQHLLLRPVGEGQYIVIGECFVSGYCNGEAVLGPLPPEIQQIFTVIGRRPWWVYDDTSTGVRHYIDPRLRSLGVDLTEYEQSLEQKRSEQESLDKKLLEEDCDNYLEIQPEELSSLLGARGVKVQSIDLV
ncbi:putative ankyrin and het domain protein [Rosellinia necatrix]|uniref:Putative ankyrin and het domain protein n=1 Tax=Rosellinia necatrix TaxID=77044 RepID=A0A1W2TFQ1_ROSNE|nr:putative ankyrin and het domain protein [Rosellinia necatrix]